MLIPTWLPEALTTGIFALAASFSGAWVALKLQERHETKKENQRRKETCLNIYTLLSEQLQVLESIKGHSIDKNDLWITAISRLSEPTRSITFDTSDLRHLLPMVSGGLYRDIVIAQNRFIVTVKYLKEAIEDIKRGNQPITDSLDAEIDNGITLLSAVSSELEHYAGVESSCPVLNLK